MTLIFLFSLALAGDDAKSLKADTVAFETCSTEKTMAEPSCQAALGRLKSVVMEELRRRRDIYSGATYAFLFDVNERRGSRVRDEIANALSTRDSDFEALTYHIVSHHIDENGNRVGERSCKVFSSYNMAFRASTLLLDKLEKELKESEPAIPMIAVRTAREQLDQIVFFEAMISAIIK